MNIGQMVRVFLGDSTPSDPKTLDLKVGQIVKGLVLQLLSEQDALVNIAGVPVRARLETPLRQGQVTLLQVQPESSGGQVVLKPLGSSDVPIPEDSVGILLKSLGLPDQANQRLAARLLHQEGAPVTKENVQHAAEVMSNKPGEVPEDEWKQATALTVKKGLPVTVETVGALRQSMYGQPVHQLTAELGEKLQQLLHGGQQLSPAATVLLQQTAETFKQLNDQTTSLLTQGGGAPLTQPHETEAVVNVNAPLKTTNSEKQPELTTHSFSDSRKSEPQSFAVPAGKFDLTVSDTEAKAALTTLKSGVIGNDAATQAQSAAPIQDNAEKAVPRSSSDTVSQSDVRKDEPNIPGKNQELPTSAGTKPNVVQTILKLIGVDHEQKWMRLLQHTDAKDITLLTGDLSGDESLPALTPEQRSSMDSLKSQLIQLTQSSDMPAGLKETAQQLLQQVTGTQLLMMTDRNAPFSQVTLMLPFINPETGGQTAAVHIQSRRGKRGELDAQNCRLLFDLQMKTLGSTLVDVMVVDRKVSLDIHNDFPAFRELIENHREEITAGLQQAGYQLLSMKSAPFPEAVPSKNTASDGIDGTLLTSRYHAKPYKGMDIRV